MAPIAATRTACEVPGHSGGSAAAKHDQPTSSQSLPRSAKGSGEGTKGEPNRRGDADGTVDECASECVEEDAGEG